MDLRDFRILPVSVQRHVYEKLVRPQLFKIGDGDPEEAHEWMLDVLHVLPSTVPGIRTLGNLCLGAPKAPITVGGVHFPGRVGVAAGLDKDGKGARMWAGLGFGFAELGTVTAQPQPGNPIPRMFRLKASKAVLNRMGFNNHGAQALAKRLKSWGVVRGQNTLGIPLGVSIGKTKVVPVDEAIPDYLSALEAVAPYADYIAINVSSPNTPDLRKLQERSALTELTQALVAKANQLDGIPVWVKAAPDLTDAQFDDVLEVAQNSGLSGLILTNTTLARDGLALVDQRMVSEAGGLSGAPLTLRSRQIVSRISQQTNLPIMGVGGIMTSDDGLAMLDAGASLIQLFTGFIYGGTALVASCNDAFAQRMQRKGF